MTIGVDQGALYVTHSGTPYTGAEVGDFIRGETGWTCPNGRHALLLRIKGVEMVYALHKDELASMALAIPTGAPLGDGPTFHIANVCTARAHRRRGLARRVMQELIELCVLRGATEVRLTAVVSAMPLYVGLGFKTIPEWRMDCVARAIGPARPSGRVRRVDRSDAAAVEFEANAFGRQGLSTIESQTDAACFMIGEGHATAVCWMHALHSNQNKAWIGPLVAQTPALATELLQGSLALWREIHGDGDVSGLALPEGAGGNAVAAFKDAGFKVTDSVPMMRKMISGPMNDLPKPGPFAFAIHNWFGS